MGFNYKWHLKDANFTKDKGNVFSCFACGGGSTMGYKLAGFNVIGCNEIDPKMMAAYKANHHPQFAYLEPIQQFKLREDLPAELFNLDILDGSPPCSSFSFGGVRERDWGVERKFKEGQANQVLDTLFFDFIDLAKRLQPKAVVAENVEGLIQGKAKAYVRRIYREFDEAGYYVQHWLFDASTMGVPQQRRRVFFLALRKDLAAQFLYQKDMFTVAPMINLSFNERPIPFGEIQDPTMEREPITPSSMKYFEKANDNGVYDERANGGMKFGYFRKAMKHLPLSTIMSGNEMAIEEAPLRLTTNEFSLGGSFPLDYDFNGQDPQYIIGMSVPPVMVAQIATRIYQQWLSKI